MWGILDDLERLGYRLKAADVVGENIFSTPSRELRDSPGVLAFQPFDEDLFMPALVTDLLAAQSEVIVSSDRISERVSTVISTILEKPIARGVRVVVRFGRLGMASHDDQIVLQQLRRIGVVLLPVDTYVPSAVVVDSEVLWLGALTPLDCLDGTQGTMVRAVSVEASQRALSMLECDDSGLGIKSGINNSYCYG
jgi:hypothetical protein